MEKKKSIFMNPAYIRVIFAILLGILLLVWPSTALTYLISLIGVLFLFAGLFSLYLYYAGKKTGKGSSSIVAASVGSSALGIWLMYDPAFFVNIIMWLLGALLVLAGIQQVYSLYKSSQYAVIPLYFYIFPVLVLICGIVVLANPFSTATGALILFGIAILFYGVVGLVNLIKFRKQYSKSDVEIH